ncbi:MAG: hypothetical protein ETSY1_01880 [Candidatus Entotheonella factor]|uniref:DUF7450 domain-containing protein n=1 Tax=Entotheonella factor TaxID=1429438 RepID=W4LZX3_ENTF1|nr:MAG: hypothetical protein ETSY1_01880 [Candidatus Entotheonella factor]
MSIAGILAMLMMVAWSGQANAQKLEDVDHYRCYSVDQHGQLPGAGVALKDQFRSDERRVRQITSICAPVSKSHNGEVTEPRYPEVHLVCYDIRPKQFVGKDVAINNQFGEARMTVAAEMTLCVPSFKKHLN